MLNYIYQTLRFFRNAFPRNITWLMFCMVVLGFIGASEMIGVTSFCRFWCLNTTGYYAFLHFFRSSTWSLDKVTEYWNRFVLSQNETVKSNGRVVLQADHTYVPKDGRQMPCVATLHQHSETQSKPSYFRGHCWGAIGILIGSMAPPFCTPLSLQIHQGLIHVNDDDNIEDSTETLGTRIVQMAIDFAMKHSGYCILTLDAFSPSASVFKLAGSVLCVWHQVPLIMLIIRAKKNCVAYFEAQTQQKKGPGRPPKYGEKVRLSDLFDHQHLFSKIECTIYGKVEEVSITSRDLLWKPTAGLVRFVLAITSRGPIILMCSHLNQDPVVALELYCARVRIETIAFKKKILVTVSTCYSIRFSSRQFFVLNK